MLLLQGMAGNYHPGDYLEEARQFYRGAIASNDGDRVVIPVPDIGRPRFEMRFVPLVASKGAADEPGCWSAAQRAAR